MSELSRVFALAEQRALEEALALAGRTADDPAGQLRVGVLEAALGRGTARIEAQLGSHDAVGWEAAAQLAIHHLRAGRVAPAQDALRLTAAERTAC